MSQNNNFQINANLFYKDINNVNNMNINNLNNNNNINFNNIDNMNNMNIMNISKNFFNINNQINNFQNISNIDNFNSRSCLNITPDQKKESIKIIMQCLSKLENITNYFLNKSLTKEFLDFPNVFPITSSYIKMLEKSSKKYKNFEYFSVKEFLKIFEKNYCYNSYKLENIYTFIIEKIHQESKTPIENNNINIMNIGTRDQMCVNFYNNKFLPENTTIISKNIFGIKELDIKCGNCHNLNYEFEIFKFIEFHIKEIYTNIIYKAQMLLQSNRNQSFINLMNNAHYKKITLEDCFDFYMNFNQQKNNFFCSKCFTQGNNSTYNYRLVQLPNILCIILNYDAETKINVEFPEKLDISKYLESFVVKKKL